MSISNAVLCAAARTAIGTYGGALKDVPAPDLGATAIRAFLERAKLHGSDIGTVAMGQVVQAGAKMNPARQPPELMAAQSRLVTGLIESLAAQTRAWAELTQKLHDCCSATVREAAAEAGEPAGRPVPIKSHSDGERPASKASTKRTAQG